MRQPKSLRKKRQKQCPHCQHLTVAPFPQGVRASIQYGTTIGAIGVYLVHPSRGQQALEAIGIMPRFAHELRNEGCSWRESAPQPLSFTPGSPAERWDSVRDVYL